MMVVMFFGVLREAKSDLLYLRLIQLVKMERIQMIGWLVVTIFQPPVVSLVKGESCRELYKRYQVSVALDQADL